MKLIIRHLTKSFSNKVILSDISYEFEQGKIYGIIGKNGAGKTTLFRCIFRDLSSDDGEILIYDDEYRSTEFDDIGFVSAAPSLPEFLTGYEFIDQFIKLSNIKAEQTINEYFELVRIEDVDRHKLIRNYSYGMKNKLQLLCCIIKNPSVLLLDEPLSSFDILVSYDIKELLLTQRKHHITLMSTHIMQLAKDVCDEIVLLKDGKLIGLEVNDNNRKDIENVIMEALK